LTAASCHGGGLAERPTFAITYTTIAAPTIVRIATAISRYMWDKPINALGR